MRNRTKLAVILAAVLTALFGVTYTALAATPAPVPVGQYPSTGHIVQCVQTASPYAVKAHPGAESKACPTGTRKLTFALQGTKGQTGPAGAKGAKGDPGTSAPAEVYGTADVNISRGGAAATTWASATTRLGVAQALTASNTFKMTCQTAQAPCKISVSARTSNPAPTKVYPRLVIQRQPLDGGPLNDCEYADGTTNDGGTADINEGGTVLPLGIGGSLDCGAGQVRPDSGIVNEIHVPAGYYTLALTAAFTLQ